MHVFNYAHDHAQTGNEKALNTHIWQNLEALLKADVQAMAELPALCLSIKRMLRHTQRTAWQKLGNTLILGF